MGRTRQLTRELTPRQRQVLDLLARGHTNAEIGEKLGITLAGAKWHVSELLTKLDANTREELAERWLQERRPTQRLRRWFGAIAAFSRLKLSAALVGATAVVAGVGVAVGVIALRVEDEGTAPTAAVTAETPPATAAKPLAAAPIPAATLPAAAPGAVWTPQEALDYATEFMNHRILSGESIDPQVATPPPVKTTDLVQAEWLPAISRFNAMDGDRYWTPNDALPRDAWHFRWVVEGVPVAGLSTPTRTFWAEMLIIDGSVQEPLAWEVELIVPGQGNGLIGGGGGFQSRVALARVASFSEPTGPETHLAWLNNGDGPDWLTGYPTAAGTWCYRQYGARGQRDGSCSFAPTGPQLPVMFSGLTTGTPAGISSTKLIIQTTDDVVRLDVLPGDGRVLHFDVLPAPPDIPQGSRYAYLEVGNSTAELTVIGYDATGKELGRRNGPGLPGPTPPPRTP